MKLARFIGYCILAVSLVYFAVAAWKYAGSMPRVPWNAVTAMALAASILLYLVQFVTSGYAWHLWLRTLHEPTRPAIAIALFSFPQFAKYVPAASRIILPAWPWAAATAWAPSAWSCPWRWNPPGR